MNPVLFVGLSLAGGVGAASRLLVDGIIRAKSKVRFPVGTAVINIGGSLLLGLLAGLVLHHVVGPNWQLVLGTGFLGGYTTFSTASFETVRLAQQRRWDAALSNGVGLLCIAVAAAGLGLWIGTSL